MCSCPLSDLIYVYMVLPSVDGLSDLHCAHHHYVHHMLIFTNNYLIDLVNFKIGITQMSI